MIIGAERPPIQRLEKAMARWRDLLGSDHVIASGDAVDRANLATFRPSGRVCGIIRPGSTAEVQDCMRVANELEVPVHPVSRGRNWGYGSRTPPIGAAVLMELGRMDRIVEFSEELAYVRVQPGVTFEQLSSYLEGTGSLLQIDATAGPHDGSMVGNALERGRSHGPATTSARPVGDFEVVLPDGRLIHTGSRRFPFAPHGPTEPFPVGPDVAGIFFESNVGIVTEMTLWLARRAKDTRVVRIGLATEAAMLGVIAAVRDLMLDGVLSSGGVLMINDSRRRHAARVSGHQPLPREYHLHNPAGAATAAQSSKGFPLWPDADLAWLCTATVYSPDAVIGDRRIALVKDALVPFATRTYETRIANVGARPHPEFWRNPLWEKTTAHPPDLDRDRVGYIFVAPVAPAVAEQVGFVYEQLRTLLRDSGFEPYVNLRFWDARSVVFVGSIVYDQDDPQADRRAIGCYESIMEVLGGQGYLPYRLPTFAMQRLPQPRDDWGGFWADVKRALDPRDVLSPGRYDFRYCWP